MEQYTNSLEKKRVEDLLNLVSKKILKNTSTIKMNNEESWMLAAQEFSEKRNLSAILFKKDYYVQNWIAETIRTIAFEFGRIISGMKLLAK